jgi:GST-like protein
MITLYGMSSPNVRKALIGLEEMRLPYRTRHVAVFRGAQFDSEITALNPMAKVPILIDPGGPAGAEPIFETGAILVYLAESYGREFLPPSGPARYGVLKWLFVQAASMGPALGNNSHFRLIAADNTYAAARFRRMSAQVYRALDARLGQAPWLGGESYSIADMAAWPWARYFRRHGMRDDDCPRLIEWIERVGDRPAVRVTDAPMAAFGELDRRDREAATPQELAMFTGQHIPCPTAEEAAAGIPTSERGSPRSPA